ncbi:DNA polymerase [Thermus oshimai]
MKGPTPPPVYRVADLGDLNRFRTRLMGEEVAGFDLETTGLDPHRDRIAAVSFYLPGEGAAYVLDLNTLPLEPVLELFGETPNLVGHNLGFDLSFLMAQGVYLRPQGGSVWDTGLVDQVLGARARMRALKDLAAEVGVTLDKDLQVSDWTGPLSEDQVRYAGLDAWSAWAVAEAQRPRVRVEGLEEVVGLEMAALPAVALMRLKGVPFDPEVWEGAAREAEEERERILRDLQGYGDDLFSEGPNWDSPKQVLHLFRRLGVDLADTREETLAGVDHPLARALLRYREVQKRLSTYGRDWGKWIHPRTGRVHPEWRQIGAETGRMACARPNLMQVPRDPLYRRAFRPGEGRVLVKADYSQIELRIAAEISGDRAMLAAYREGQDLHVLTASRVLGKPPGEVTKEDRQLAKAVNFGLVYGMGARSFQVYAKTGYGVDLTLEEAERLRTLFFKTYPGLRAWHRQQPEGEAEVKTLAGRKRRTGRFTEKLNTPVQGTGADGLKLALALLYGRLVGKGLQDRVFPVLAVHDEIVLEAPTELAKPAALLLKNAMREGMKAAGLKEVPVEVEVGVYRDWGVTPVEVKREEPEEVFG